MVLSGHSDTFNIKDKNLIFIAHYSLFLLNQVEKPSQEISRNLNIVLIYSNYGFFHVRNEDLLVIRLNCLSYIVWRRFPGDTDLDQTNPRPCCHTRLWLVYT